jgi:PIN domain nuclease of toxin-antitoxin system
VRLLLDTSVFLWWRDKSPRLPSHLKSQIRDPDNDIIVSIASLWEIAIKRGLGKLEFPEDFEEVMAEEQFDLLTVTYRHLQVLGELPQHHRDPFDRLLMSQSLAESIPIVTNDPAFAAYSVEIVW